MPTTLDETYDRMLEHIAELGPAECRHAFTLLRWLAYAITPITLAELQSAVTIRPEDDEVDFENQGYFTDSPEILAGLVVFSDGASSTKDGSDADYDKAIDDLTPATYIRLAHFSVKEYLESDRILKKSAYDFPRLEAGAAHRFLSQSCLTYLMAYSKIEEKAPWFAPERDFDRFRLLKYAANRWYGHSRLQSGNDVSREVALLEWKDARFQWLRFDKIGNDGLGLGASTVGYVPSICYAVYARLPRVVKALLEAGEDVNAVGPYHAPLLVTATENADLATMELLIAHGADVNMFSTGYTSEIALFSAAFEELPLTQLLVDHGADVNLVCGHGTALSAASKCGNQPVVKFLLEKGALVDLVDGSRRTALIEASSNKCNEVVELLIAKGADVNSPNTHITPLIAAARSGNADGVAILINAGADINAQNSGALLDAILGGHAQTAALLETRGAKSLTSEQLNDSFVRVCDERISRGRPYHYDPERAVVLLLERGADVNSHDSSALLAALEQGHENMVALLEAKGAKQLTLEQLNGALFKVCSRRQRHYPETPVRLLLDRGADAHLVDRWARPSWVRHGAS
jgi:ankyrin repeat protein